MAVLVIAGGQSVTDYEGSELAILAKSCFTFGVNNSGFIWPADVIVALDPDWILKYRYDLTELKRPIITRKWACLQEHKLTEEERAAGKRGLDLIEIPNETPHRLSGIVACLLADNLARTAKTDSFVIGMDHTAGHYYNRESDCSKVVQVDTYDKLGLTNTINLGIHSKISCWPKRSKLPRWQKAASTPMAKEVFKAWLRGEAAGICK